MVSLSLWMLVAATLGWCGAVMVVSFTMARGATKGKKEAVIVGPLLMLPFMLLSALPPWAIVRVTLIFTYGWVTPWKLLLLSSASFLLDCRLWTLSHFSHFLFAFLLPLRIKGVVKGGARLPHGSLWYSLIFDLCALVSFLSLYDSMVPPVSHAAHCLVLYLVLDLPHLIASMVLLGLFGVETQPMFRKPWVSTSLTDFWGSRWDLMANALLRHSVYNPIVNLLTANADIHLSSGAAKSDGKQLAVPSSLVFPAPSNSTPLPLWVRLIGVNTTFFVSGLIHELLYFSLTQAVAPTWQVTTFFVVHGLATSAEITLRRACPKHAIFKMPRPLKIVLTMYFTYATSAWLFFPQLVSTGIFMKCTTEYRAIKEMMGMRSL